MSPMCLETCTIVSPELALGNIKLPTRPPKSDLPTLIVKKTTAAIRLMASANTDIESRKMGRDGREIVIVLPLNDTLLRCPQNAQKKPSRVITLAEFSPVLQ